MTLKTLCKYYLLIQPIDSLAALKARFAGARDKGKGFALVYSQQLCRAKRGQRKLWAGFAERATAREATSSILLLNWLHSIKGHI